MELCISDSVGNTKFSDLERRYDRVSRARVRESRTVSTSSRAISRVYARAIA